MVRLLFGNARYKIGDRTRITRTIICSSRITPTLGHRELTKLIKRYYIANLNIVNFFLVGDYLTQRNGYCLFFINVNPKESLRWIIITNSVLSNVLKVSYHLEI